MSLINCPECNKEISDTVNQCPNCGFRVKSKKKIKTPMDKKKTRLLLIIGGSVVILAGAITVIYFTIIQPRAIYTSAQSAYEAGNYDEAIEFCNQIKEYNGVDSLLDDVTYAKAEAAKNQGNYDEAINLLQSIPDYDGASLLLEIATYEKAKLSYEQNDYDGALKLLSTIPNYEEANVLKDEIIYSKADQLFSYGDFQGAKEELKNATKSGKVNMLLEKITIYEEVLESCTNLKATLKNPESLQIFEIRYAIVPENSNPVVMFDCSGQNGFGGMTRSYMAFVNGQYSGNCSSLNVFEIDAEDFDELSGWLVLSMYWDSYDTLIDVSTIENALNAE